MRVFASNFNCATLLDGAYVSVGPSLVVSHITLYCLEPSLPLMGEITFALKGVSFKALNGTFTSIDGQDSLLCPKTYRGPSIVFYWGREQLPSTRNRKVLACPSSGILPVLFVLNSMQIGSSLVCV
jgi:hypothetical protein